MVDLTSSAELIAVLSICPKVVESRATYPIVVGPEHRREAEVPAPKDSTTRRRAGISRPLQLRHDLMTPTHNRDVDSINQLTSTTTVCCGRSNLDRADGEDRGIRRDQVVGDVDVKRHRLTGFQISAWWGLNGVQSDAVHRVVDGVC